MRLIPLNSCRAGMKLAKPIMNEEGKVLLGREMELTDALLKRLDKHGISFLYIFDPLTEDVEIKETLSMETRIAATQTIRGHFRKQMTDSLKTKAPVKFELGASMRSLMDSLIDELSANREAMVMLGDMQITDHYLYQHSLNVCVYTTLLGMKYGYSRDELGVLGLGAMLHDLGKTRISQQVLLKPGSLTAEEFEEIKRHPSLGFDMLRGEPNIPLLSAHVAFQHHERLDGTGYPRGLKGEEIHEYARWVGMVDVFDALTTFRVYRDALLPHQAMEMLYAGAGTKFDVEKIKLFRDKIAIYPLGVEVTLSTGETGVVVDLNANFPHRPIVRILMTPEGEAVQTPYEIDLTKKLDVVIAEVNGSGKAADPRSSAGSRNG